MLHEILDTSVLIKSWREAGGQSVRGKTDRDAMRWADHLIAIRKTNAILTPVYLEFVAYSKNEHELGLYRAFLGRFRIIDRGNILSQDWKEAKRLVERVPRDGKPRQLGDCLIRAIASRLNCGVASFDKRFPGFNR